MGLNFYDYDGLQPKTTPPKHISQQCTMQFDLIFLKKNQVKIRGDGVRKFPTTHIGNLYYHPECCHRTSNQQFLELCELWNISSIRYVRVWGNCGLI